MSKPFKFSFLFFCTETNVGYTGVNRYYYKSSKIVPYQYCDAATVEFDKLKEAFPFIYDIRLGWGIPRGRGNKQKIDKGRIITGGLFYTSPWVPFGR